MNEQFADELLGALDAIGAETNSAIARFMGDKEMYLKYICDFPQEPTMQCLRDAVAGKNYNAAKDAVHALKGIVINLGLVPFGDTTVDMLEELRENNIPAAMEAYETVEKQYTRFCDVINAHKANAEAE